MNIKNNNSYYLKKDGQIKFASLDRLKKMYERPESVWEHPVASLILLAVCGVGDAALFYQLFWASLYGSTLVLMISVTAMLIGFDVAPIYLGHSIKKRHQREVLEKKQTGLAKNLPANTFRRNIVAEFVLGTAMMVAFVANIFVRISLKDLLFEDYGSYGDTGESNRALVFAIFFIALPVITSLVSFAVSYIISNPLKAAWLKLKTEQFLLEEECIEFEAMLKEYELLPEYMERLEETDKAKYRAKEDGLDAMEQQYKDFVRLFISEISGDPSATNLLTRDVNENMSVFTSEESINQIIKKHMENNGIKEAA